MLITGCLGKEIIMAYNPHDHHDGHHKHHNPAVDHGVHSNDQRSVKTFVGRGLEGSSAEVVIEREGVDYEFLSGYIYNPQTNERVKIWTTENIHGGQLQYFVNPHYDEDPAWFTITFIYTKEGKAEYDPTKPENGWDGWHFTTPAMPYIAPGSGAGIDNLPGSGVSTIFINPGKIPAGVTWNNPNPDVVFDQWSERTVYPLDPANPGQRFDPDLFNAPNSPDDDRHVFPWFTNEKDWTVNLEFGRDGNLGVPNWPEIQEVIDNTEDALNELERHIHEDMGFGNWLINDGDTGAPDINPRTIKNYIDWNISQVTNNITNINNSLTAVKQTLADIVNKVYGGGTINNQTGVITWPNTMKIAIGNMNHHAQKGGSGVAGIIQTTTPNTVNDTWAR
jgi:hypothetical protein